MLFDAWRVRRAERRMKDPVRGVFRDNGNYSKYGGTWKIFFHGAGDLMHTGVITAPGIPATPVEHKGTSRWNAIWNMRDEYPVLVDRADPGRFVILWNEVPTSRGTEALSRARAEADRLNAAQDQPPGDWSRAE